MSTNKPQQPGAGVNVFLSPLQVCEVQQFRERYAQWQACENEADSVELGRKVKDFAFKVACSVDGALGQAEA